jgi:L-rhamnose mutarotase
MQRVGQVIGIKPEKIQEYEELHRAVWPDVLATIHACNIQNYSIYRHEDRLFSYFEYTGDDYEADMATMAGDPKTQEWWSLTAPMQDALPGRGPNDWWTPIPEVFHAD